MAMKLKVNWRCAGEGRGRKKPRRVDCADWIGSKNKTTMTVSLNLVYHRLKPRRCYLPSALQQSGDRPHSSLERVDNSPRIRTPWRCRCSSSTVGDLTISRHRTTLPSAPAPWSSGSRSVIVSEPKRRIWNGNRGWKNRGQFRKLRRKKKVYIGRMEEMIRRSDPLIPTHAKLLGTLLFRWSLPLSSRERKTGI